MKRIQLLKSQLSNINKNKHNSLERPFSEINPMEEYLNKQELEYLIRFRKYSEKNFSRKELFPYSEKTEFPMHLIKEYASNFPGSINLDLEYKDFPKLSNNLTYALMIESGKIDISLFTFTFVHGRMCTGIIKAFGSQEQIDHYIPEMIKLNKIGSFCLTEINVGSEAHNLQTTFEETQDGSFIINGNKRWIGNAPVADVLIVFAKEKTKKDNKGEKIKPRVCGFLVEPKNKLHNPNNNISITKIEDKLALKLIQNGEIKFNDVVVSKSQVLPNMNSFEAISDHLIQNRMGLCFPILGMLIGSYQRALNYSVTRKQFNREIASFQLIQEKLVKMRANIEAIFSLIHRVNENVKINGWSQGKVGMAKSWSSHLSRDSIMLAREIFGGNGILYDNYVMNAMLDIEAMITVEGTYEVNILACGREITGGIPAYY